MSDFADACRKAYKNRGTTDTDFYTEYQAKRWPSCRRIVETDCMLIAHHQAFLLVRNWSSGETRDNHVSNLAVESIGTVVRQIDGRKLILTGKSISNYMFGVIRNERAKLGLVFRRKDAPAAIRAAGMEAIELYGWWVKMRKSRSECRSLLIQHFGLHDPQVERLFGFVEPWAAKTHKGDADIVSLDAGRTGEDNAAKLEIPDHRNRPDTMLRDREINRIFNMLIDRLPPREGQIIRWIYEDGEKNVAAKIKKHFKVKSEYYEKTKAKEAFRELCRSVGIDATYFN